LEKEYVMIAKTIQRQFEIAKQRQWDRTFWAVDLHGTVIKPNYRDDELPTDYYPSALKTMRLLTMRTDIILIMYTCSHPAEIKRYLEKFRADEIHFDHVNKNPEVKSEGYGHYEDKPYFNLLLDDKAGFDPDVHWQQILETMPGIPVLPR
jgi:hypothetical protein